MKILLAILAGIGGLVALALLVMFSPWVEAAFRNTFLPRTIETADDLPWAGPSTRASYFAKYHADINTGLTSARWWGSSARRSEDPIATGNRAFTFLEKHRAMNVWPPAMDGGSGTFTTYSVYDQLSENDRHYKSEYGSTMVTYPIRVAPYRFQVVSLQPTVVVMQPAPELLAWWTEYREKEFDDATQWVRWTRGLKETQRVPHLVWLQNPLEFGTVLPLAHNAKAAEWLWFSPDLERLPAALPLSREQPTSIDIKQGRLHFEPVPAGWRVTRD